MGSPMASKRVLMVSESLRRGGLETRLWTQARALRRAGHNVVLATASPEVPKALAEAVEAVHAGLAIGADASSWRCAKAAEALARRIFEQHVDVVHAHPYVSLLPGAMAAALAEVPLLVTAHGPTSFVGGPNVDMVLFNGVLPYASTVEVVSEELKALMPTELWPRLQVRPNCVEVECLGRANRVADGPWAFVGRLEDSKSQAFETLVRWSPALGIKTWHVWGEGREQEALVKRLHETTPEVQVKFLGWSDDVASALRDGYAGVAGMGRVALEAAAMELPFILAGYSQVHGLLSDERFEGWAWSNFSGRGAEAVTSEQLAAELRKVSSAGLKRLRALVEATHDVAKSVGPYEAMLNEARVEPLARARMLQIHGLMRRSDASADAPGWAMDPALSGAISALLRQAAEPFLPTVAYQITQAVEASVLAAVAPLKAQLAASDQTAQGVASALAALEQQVTNLARQYASLVQQQVSVGQLQAEFGQRQSGLGQQQVEFARRQAAVAEQLTALSQRVSELKEALPRPLVEQTKEVVARLRKRPW